MHEGKFVDPLLIYKLEHILFYFMSYLKKIMAKKLQHYVKRRRGGGYESIVCDVLTGKKENTSKPRKDGNFFDD